MAADAGGSSYTASKGRMGQICRSFMEKSGRDILLWLLSVPAAPSSVRLYNKNLVAQLADKEELLMVPVKNSVAGAGSLVKRPVLIQG